MILRRQWTLQDILQSQNQPLNPHLWTRTHVVNQRVTKNQRIIKNQENLEVDSGQINYILQ